MTPKSSGARRGVDETQKEEGIRMRNLIGRVTEMKKNLTTKDMTQRFIRPQLRSVFLVSCLLIAPNFAIAQCAAEAQARIVAEHRSTDIESRRGMHPTVDWEKGKRQFAENVNSALPREVASAKQDGVWNSKNPQFKLTTERRITEYKSQIDRSRQNQSRSRYPADVANMERGISDALYRICLLEESLKAVNTSLLSSNSAQTLPADTQVPAQKGNAPQQNESAQQQAQQTQQLAAQNQTRADQARQGKRRRHEPENEASQCIQPDFGGLYGGMKNTCDFKVWYTYCGYRPKENSWLTGMSCEKQSFGSDSVGPGRTSASHTKGVESIHWIACKEPAWTVDTEFVPGQGIKGRCHTVGGN